MTIRASLLGAVAALVFAAPAAAQDFIIVNATLVIGDGSEPFEDGVVVVERGRVTYAGPAAGQSYATGQIIDVNEAWVTPGLVAAVTDLGLVDVSGVQSSNDVSAGSSRFNAALDRNPCDQSDLSAHSGRSHQWYYPCVCCP